MYPTHVVGGQCSAALGLGVGSSVVGNGVRSAVAGADAGEVASDRMPKASIASIPPQSSSELPTHG